LVINPTIGAHFLLIFAYWNDRKQLDVVFRLVWNRFGYLLYIFPQAQQIGNRMKKERNIGEVIEAMFEKYRMKQKMHEVQLVKIWEEITGPLISKHTTELKLVNKTLYVTFDNAPLKNEMMYRRFQLIEAVNQALGQVVVEKIFIR
jgi:hypothetical protein